MKRFFCLILALLLLAPAAAADEEKMTFHLEGASGEIGDTVTIVGSVQNAPAVASFRVIMTYDDTVLEVQEGKKLDAKGMFIINTNASYEGQKAVNALSADASLVLEGNMDLFSVTFKIIGTPAEEKGALIQVAHSEFFKDDLSRLYPVIEPCRSLVGAAGSDPKPEQPDAEGGNPSGGNTGPAESSGNTGSDANQPNTEGGQGGQAPSGYWSFEGEQVFHLEENGDSAVYRGEYIRDENGRVTRVELYDEQDQKAGTLTVEEDESSALTVTAQDLSAAAEPDKSGSSALLWICLAAAAAAAVVLIVFLYLKHRNRLQKGTEEGGGDA